MSNTNDLHQHPMISINPNPVVDSAYLIHSQAQDVRLSCNEQIEQAAESLLPYLTTYSPLTWQTQPLHLLPASTPSSNKCSLQFPKLKFNQDDKACLDWIFFVSSLNFSFWSDLPSGERWGKEWYADGWKGLGGKKKRWEGYWGLLAVVNSALENGHPLTDPSFYSSTNSADLIKSLFAPTSPSKEEVPLLQDRLSILQKNGSILCSPSNNYNGSWAGFLEDFFSKDERRGALDLVKEVVRVFESFRDEGLWKGEKVCFWKRAQILVAETWAAFYPSDSSIPHPIFPNGLGELTMFPDYRVPQHLHTLKLLTYSPSLYETLSSHANLPHGSRLEMELRAGSIVAIEEVRKTLRRLRDGVDIESVVLDFLIWDLAKEMEAKAAKEGGNLVECHRTRSIYY
ncbi:Cobyrinic acid a,c-diamide synthase [Phaffia rhodozyma]|uniref:Queuosine 5'-phosphate N-glycosylase/hydrolase n=1 Tax=Phaffia rhodozyma TaxID=264483 RepID=A0A0F7SMB6_PHARH|nr:Cobyrinic acid a,c-diamide synthase [Phaffia rhodozyma]